MEGGTENADLLYQMVKNSCGKKTDREIKFVVLAPLHDQGDKRVILYYIYI